jgi:hypothetical protein
MEETIGKLAVKLYINTKPEDKHGRQTGKWVTLMTEHGLTQPEAKQAADQFMMYNSQLRAVGIDTGGNRRSHELHAEWTPYMQHIYID